MRKLFRTAAMSAFAALGITAAMPAAANAEGIYFGFDNGGARFGVYDTDSNHRRYRNRDDWEPRRHDFRRDDWRRDDRRRRDRGCSPERALGKAERLGLHRVRLRDVDRDTIRVSGRRHGDRITVTFARAPHCPVVGF